jgi:predicted kinase
MAEIVLCCGKVCSGKSTFAKLLEDEYGFFHFSADQWMLHFYGEPVDRRIFELQLSSCKEMIISIAYKLLSHGHKVVLDFGFWRKTERQAACSEVLKRGHRATIIYFPVDYEKQLAYMRGRQSSPLGDHYNFTESAVRDLNRLFEEPDETEVVVSQNDYLNSLARSR